MPASGRVIGGSLTKPYRYPFVFAMLEAASQHHSIQLCAATRLSSMWLVTAAHCVQPGNTEIHVRYLEHNLSHTDACSSDGIAYVRMHPLWTRKIIEHDIAMLRLRDPIASKCNVAGHDALYATLPTNQTVLKPSASVVGWGHGSSYVGHQLLHRAQLATVDKQQCESIWKYDMTCHHCAGNETADACYGDSGGPLLDEDNTILGIVSYGSSETCASTTHPTVFVDVGCYLGWILSYVESEASQEDSCECTSDYRSDGVLVRYIGCGLHFGVQRWCYASGGLKCLSAHPSALHPGAGWRSCDSAPDDGVAPGPHRNAVLIVFLLVLAIAACYATN